MDGLISKTPSFRESCREWCPVRKGDSRKENRRRASAVQDSSARHGAPRFRASVLECAGPPALCERVATESPKMEATRGVIKTTSNHTRRGIRYFPW